MNRVQLKSEIEWLENEIAYLEAQVHNRPRKQKQIKEYRHQIEQKKLNLALGE